MNYRRSDVDNVGSAVFRVGGEMAQGSRLTDWQIETIQQAYAETGNVAHAAREAGCAYNTAKSYVRDHHDELTKLRNEKRADVVTTMMAVRTRALEELITPSRLSKASIPELSTLVGVMTDKIQLLTGGATHRTETKMIDPGALSPEEREKARQLREKLLAGAVEGSDS